MKKIILLLCIALIAMTLSAVTWQVALVDDYGDGWNGGLLSVEVNGTPVLSGITLASGAGPQYHDFWVEDGDEVTTTYTPGSYAYENYYAIFDHNAAIVAESGGTWDSPGDSTPASITTPIIVSAPVGGPGPVTDPTPANAAVGVAPNGTLTWTFGADTDTYELWFGPAGNMTMVDSGAAGATGSYAYSGLGSFQTYNWRVISQNSTRMETQGPLWSFTTQMAAVNVPYNEGFEAGNTDQTAIAGWIQEAVTGTNIWTANTSITDYNRTPRTGSWNAYLRYGNTRWMFKAFHFEAGVAYEASLFARQDGATAANASIAIAYGTEATAAGMTNSILPTTGIINGDYQYLNGVFTVPATGTYYVGILGTINFSPWYISLDDITVDLAPTEAIFNISPNVASFNFGNVPIGGFAQQVFTISNTGGADLTLGSIGIDPAGTDFSIPDYAGIAWVVAPGANTQFTVRFEPQDVGAQNADLDIVFTREDYSIALSGSAYSPATLPFTEDWEAGQGNWSIVNGTQANAWFIGSADPYAGSNSAYISNDGGVTNAYSTGSTSVTHLYTDITFGADMLEFPLSFWWKCQGEGTSWDRMRVHLVDTSVTPVAGTELTIGQFGLTNYNVQADWTQANITLPGTLSGSVKRLVFSWKNDGSGGTMPPINIDDISLTAIPIPIGPVVAPNLDNPANGTNNLPVDGFPFEFSWNTDGPEPDAYNLYMANVNDLPDTYTSDDFFAAATQFPDVSSPYTPSVTFDYGQRYVWTVSGANEDYPDEVYTWPPYEFQIEADPTISTFPHTQTFETWPPTQWDLTGGTGNFIAHVDTNSNTWAKANFWDQTSGTTDVMTTPPILATEAMLLQFTWSHLYSGSYPNDALTVQISQNLTDWTDLWYNIGEDLDSGDGADNEAPGTGVVAFVPIAASYSNTPFYLRFLGTSGWGPDLFIDNVTIDVMPTMYDLAMLDPVGSGTTVPEVGIHSIIEGTVVNLTAQPALAWFEKWEVDGAQFSTDRIAPLTMNAPHSAQAFFSLPAGSLAEDFNLADPVPGEWSETATTVAWDAGDDTFFFNMFDSFALIGQVATDPEEMLITPEVVLDGTVTKLSYWLAGGNNIYGYGSSTVQVKYQAADTRVWTPLGDPIDLANGEGPMYISLDLSAIPNGTYQFAFAVSSTFDYSTYLSWVGIDNVVGPRLADVVMNDLAVTQVNYPNQIISDGETAVLSATIKNNGLNPQSGTQVTFTINDGRTVLTTNIGTLNYNETEIVTVNYTTVGGRHTITASVPADDNLTNNSATTQGIIAVEGNLAEGFEGTVDGWTLGDASQWTLNNITWLPPYEGNWAAYCYGATFTDDRLITPKVVLTGAEELNFHASFGNQSTGAASLAVDYSADGETWTNILPAFAPTETSQPYTVDLSSIPAGEYYLAFNGSGTNDGTYNTILSLDFVFGPELAIVDVDTPANVAIALVDGTPQLSWDEVPAAQSYIVYSSTDPYGEFTHLGSTNATSYDLTADQAKLFYHVTASTDDVPIAAATIPNVTLRAQTSLNAAQAPQITPAGNLKTNNRNRQQVILPKK